MTNFKTLNNLFGWLAFAIATITYVLTMEQSVSFWDCGEFISASFKLQVVHPPGAPFFLLIERILSMLSGGDLSKVAYFTNLGTSLCSSATILFLFWTITMLARKVYAKNENELTLTEKIIVLGSGLVGALAYTFSDTFWFSAVETEVYAMSSLCTAVVFWAILKWENVANERHADRWLVFIAYIVGLSIGVQLLNLLAIPAITFVYYFKRFRTSTKGIIYTALISVGILGFVMVGFIRGLISIASKFDLLFVNEMGMPFWSGAAVWFLLIIAAVVWGIRWSIKKGKVVLNTAILCFVAILIGYSSYTIIPIRAKADPNINMYANDNIFNLLSYLNREQYGETPILTGQFFTAQLVDQKEGAMQYRRGEDKYIETSKKIIPVWDKTQSGFFPRMWSNQPNHVSFYRDWASLPAGNKKPTLAQNIGFFLSYQVGHMYIRYFMWNFAGRQNDIQGNGNITDGNWISGIKFIDEARLGPQDNLPEYLASNRARNKLYFLPLILGILGLLFHFKKNIKDASVVTMLFFFTGLAIVIYLNQSPYQPRERDYAYVGSFYAFAIWIGLGVAAIFDFLSKRKLNNAAVAVATTAICLVAVPTVMAVEEWDDHNRSGRFVARDFAYDYLNSCAPDAILFTMGDNETYPLWYLQEVEGVRTDVRVVNLSLLGMDWYINQMKGKTLEAPGVPFTLPEEKYTMGTRDYIQYYDMKIQGPTEGKDILSFITSDNPQAMMQVRTGKSINVLPTKSVKIKVDKEAVMKHKVVAEKDSALIVDELVFNISGNALVKNDLMVLDLLVHNDWSRPIYFAVTMGSDNFFGLNDYLQLEGLAYRLVPIKFQKNPIGTVGSVNTDIMYNNIMNKFKWGNIDKNIYIDPETARMIYSLNLEFYQLSEALLAEGKKDSAIKALDKSTAILPQRGIPTQYNIFRFRIADLYFRAGAADKGVAMIKDIAAEIENNLNYYAQFNGKRSSMYANDVQQGIAVINELARIANVNNQSDLNKDLLAKSQALQTKFSFLAN
jgi:hypothetical protein